MLFALADARDAGSTCIHDRNPLFVRLSDGGVRNGYTFASSTRQNVPVRFALSMSGLEDAKMDVMGAPPDATGRELVEVGPDQTREVRITVAVRSARASESIPIRFDATQQDALATASAHDFFRMP